ncbi:hypothetical protein [Aliiroseovarius sp.]|uniref:hypothetical protein n=1 Tax=Aliiroseovarius sp. TaxID=1872442 RepID=UPI003BABBD0E
MNHRVWILVIVLGTFVYAYLKSLVDIPEEVQPSFRAGTVVAQGGLWLLISGVFAGIYQALKNNPKAALVIWGMGTLLLALLFTFADLAGNTLSTTRSTQPFVLSAEYNPQRCKPSHPVLITLTNHSGKTIESWSFRLVATHPGYSDPLATGKIRSGKIVNSGDTWESCWAIPEERFVFGGIPIADVVVNAPETLFWKVEGFSPTFERH